MFFDLPPCRTSIRVNPCHPWSTASEFPTPASLCRAQRSASPAAALTCSGSRVMWSALPSFTSRLVVDHWKLLFRHESLAMPAGHELAAR